jgi:5-methylcytosine-specific restriction endonuclease McrA
MEMYQYLWEKAKKKNCKICGKWLGEVNSPIFHDHLLEKSVYEQFALDERNLILCCSDCHTLKTNGFTKEKHKELINQAKEILLK